MRDSVESGYDFIANYYDDLAGFVFGKEIFDSQMCFLNYIKPCGNVLMIGGGSGWLLIELFKINPDCTVWFIDSSARMIELAKKVSHNKGKVHFICATEMNIPKEIRFDAVVTNYYLNTIPHPQYSEKIKLISEALDESGIWLVSDFVDSGRKQHRFLSAMMHVFFKCITRHPNTKLLNWEAIFTSTSLKLVNQQSFYNGFMKSLVFKGEM